MLSKSNAPLGRPLPLLRFSQSLGALFALASVAACAPEHTKDPAPPPAIAGTTSAKVATVGGAIGARTDSAAHAAIADTMRRADAAAAPAKPAAHDSARRTSPLDSINAAVNSLIVSEGRSKQDRSSYVATIRAGLKAEASWPKPPAPLPGSVLPARRIIAFYGNPLSARMGVLGEYPVDQMLAKLDTQVARWRAADPSTPVQPALHLIAVVAQGGPGRDGKYRLRMDSSLIEKVYGWAQQRNALLFLDVQIGKSTVQEELPRLLGFLSRPNVHLGLDPEFAMHYEREGLPPGKKVGEMHAADVNYAVRTLADLVAQKHLPPKVLVVHRWTRKMMPDAEQIHVDPRVQVVMDMDGFGPPWLKYDSYHDYIVAHPVEYTGFKLFFHNDTKKGNALLSPAELLHLRPRPLYIQYQ